MKFQNVLNQSESGQHAPSFSEGVHGYAENDHEGSDEAHSVAPEPGGAQGFMQGMQIAFGHVRSVISCSVITDKYNSTNSDDGHGPDENAVEFFTHDLRTSNRLEVVYSNI